MASATGWFSGCIRAHCGPHDFNGDASIVESYISYLRRKVDIDPDAAALIQTKRGVGYVLRTAEKR